ncbi:MAG: dihydrofolate reductase family protein [Nitrospinota bacterium]|nr:dihydrofolate reductase family protein [Nitrospinota bacterium]
MEKTPKGDQPEAERLVSLFIATSLDGFIASQNGGIDWLFHDQDYGYTAFYASVDTVLTGRKTFDVSLSFSKDPFKGKQTFVFTRSEKKSPLPGSEFIYSDPVEFTRKLKAEPGGKIWLLGGGQINGLLMKAGLIDEIVMSIHPVVIGRGIPLFDRETGVCGYTLAGSNVFDTGLAQFIYRKNR